MRPNVMRALFDFIKNRSPGTTPVRMDFPEFDACIAELKRMRNPHRREAMITLAKKGAILPCRRRDGRIRRRRGQVIWIANPNMSDQDVAMLSKLQ